MKKLILNDFKRKELHPGYYFSHKTDKYEICLEVCLNGYDVAIYDLHQNLLRDKVCTNLVNIQSDEALIKAIEIANKFLKE